MEEARNKRQGIKELKEDGANESKKKKWKE